MVDGIELSQRTVARVVGDLDVILVRVGWGLIFLVVAFVVVRGILWAVRSSLYSWYDPEEKLIADLTVTVLGLFLWFGVGLAFLKIVGMGDIAVSLGTASGFIALGVSYALSDMIEDTVAGVYLLRDPDFHIGDRIESDGVTGTVAAIELRKCRIDTEDGDRMVVANRDIEPKWTRAITAAEARTDD